MGLYVLKFPFRKVLAPLARPLDRVHPDVLSYLAVAVAGVTALCYVRAADAPVLLLAAVGLTLLRMTLNTLDGVIAIRRGNLKLTGEIVNALPDRYSDILLLAGIALSPLCRTTLGVLGLASVLLVSYTGMLGKALGVAWQHHGPLGKVERLICIMVLSLVQYSHLRANAPAWQILGWWLTPLELAMLLFVGLGQVTVFNRTRGMVRQIRRLEWRKDHAHRLVAQRALVAYDSRTGNTERVAVAIAECLGADLKRIDDVRDTKDYDLVVIGSPTISSRPSEKVMRFLADAPDLCRYAAFVTYGAPVVGPAKARKALGWCRNMLGVEPVATFMCKGRHALVPMFYRSHPDENDLLSAFLFGIKLAKRCARLR